MKKQTIRKEDGRYLIFYAFDKPLPKVHLSEQQSDQPSGQPSSDGDTAHEPQAEEGGGQDV